MNETTFDVRLREILETFTEDRDGYDSLMDELATDCTEDQWRQVVSTLDAERDRLRRLATEVDQRVSSVPSIRPVVEAPVPGTVWLVFYETCDESPTLIDVCETRLGAVAAAEQHAAELNSNKKIPWRERWKQAVTVCPCPTLFCDHEQWTRRMGNIGGIDYRINSWSTADGKWSTRSGV